MKLSVNESNVAIVDGVFEDQQFKDFHSYFNKLDFNYASNTGWQKVWRITDGQILGSHAVNHSQVPTNTPFDWIDQTVYLLAKQHFEHIVGKEGEDWVDIIHRPYIYPVGTKISWHDDFAYSGACIFYCHTEWSPYWGGELFVAKTSNPEECERLAKEKSKDSLNNIITREYVNPILNEYGMGFYFSPLPNRMAFTSGKVWHAINRVDQSAGDAVRCSIVSFFKKKD
jgi:hypothetical protein